MSRADWLALGVGAAALLCAAVVAWSKSGAAAADGDLRAWGALSRAQQGEYVRAWSQVQMRADAAAILNRLRRYVALPAAQQDALRRLHEVTGQALRDAPASRRAYLLSLEPAARAVELLRYLEESAPAALREVRRILAGEGA